MKREDVLLWCMVILAIVCFLASGLLASFILWGSGEAPDILAWVILSTAFFFVVLLIVFIFFPEEKTASRKSY